ncbi:PAS domain-containing sensor histidine kinase [Paraglaciecola sp. L3A3]|uniref:sensor histidine kinase n=1 Tax=Paraglaciecola sp. L3A3 TaxID=2686358 RepID=UPI001E457143|nr:HAMP domain-containing sensor histidine kinase [Paraglaciecola sp. L3A3]
MLVDTGLHSSSDYRCSGLNDLFQNTSSEVDNNELESLRSQANRLEHLLQVMPAGVVVVDGKGVVKQSNDLAKDLLGEPLEGQLWRTIILRSFKPQADDGHEVSLHDGRKVKLSITPLIKEPGQLIVLTDLTETRQLQQRIGHLQKLSSLGKMVASLAHQIRTPLSAAMLYAANLSNGTLNKSSRDKFSDKLISRLRDLESQVNDMLLFAKSGKEQVVTEISLQNLLNEVQQGSDAMVLRHKAKLVLLLPDPDVVILGNKTALCGAIQNLIHNALEVIPDNAVITLAANLDTTKPDWVNLSVSDNGPGVSEVVREQVFEPFYTTKSNGTGLGLAVVKGVAQSHQGKVKVSNTADGGASFTICLPTFNQHNSSEKDVVYANNSQKYTADAARS